MRLGCLPYLNVKPLVYSFENGGLPEGSELVYAPPSELAAMLAAGSIDAAPVSSFATFANPGLEICPGICIASDGPVRSVLLFLKAPLSSIRRIALDTSSLSGANMLRIVLRERYGLDPEFVSARPGPVDAMLSEADAALLIGDPAMLAAKDGLQVLDLGAQWRLLTGLPAVFAVWAGSRMSHELVSALGEAKRTGVEQIEEIAETEAVRLGLSSEYCLEYLRDVIIYDLGQRELAGLDAFREKCVAHGLVASQAGSVRQ